MADFVGRESELDRLAEMADKVRTGQPQIAHVRGVAGIGKTTMVRRFVAGLADFTVLTATADLTETVVDNGVVDQLVRRVPSAVRAAAPLLARGVPADASPLAVGAQLLDVLGTLQATGSVVLVVDDAQWADVSSLQVLSFVLRRVWADQVMVLIAARPSPDERVANLLTRLVRAGPSASTTMELAGLAAPDIARLSRAVVGDDLPAPAAERLRSFTGGHPLHVRTLLAEVPAEQLRGRRIAMPPSLVSAVRATMDRLPDASRNLVEALAVLGARGPLARAARVANVPQPAEALQPALAAGLAQWWPEEPSSPVGMVHELQREAIYTGLAPGRRSVLHGRAAAVVDRGASWAHRVASASEPDEALAQELEVAAEEQADEAHHGLAATYLRWAADLSPERADHERRLLTAGVQVLFSRDRSSAAGLWPAMENCAHSALRSLCLGMTALLVRGEWAAAQRWLAEAMELGADPAQPRWVRATAAAGLAGAYAWGGRVGETVEAARLALSIGELPALLHDYTRVLLAVGVSRSAGMRAALEEMAHLPQQPGAVPTAQLDSLGCRGAMLTMLGRYPEAARDLANVVRRQRTGTFMISGSVPHCYLAAGQYQLGEWDEAAVTMEQARILEEEDEQPQNQVLRRMASVFVPAGRGDWEVAAEHVRAAHQLAQRMGGPQDLRYAAIGAAVLHQARSDHPRMLAALREVPGLTVDDASGGDGAHRWWDLWWRPLLVEGLLGTGHLDVAATQLAALTAAARDAPHARATVTRLSAWLLDASGDRQAALDTAERYLLEPDRPPAPLAEGLLEHEHGRRLLGAGRRADATTALETAKGRFGRLGAVPFERRVDVDLRRAGATDPVTGATIAGLTDREWDVARLVGKGCTNREIGARLYVTTKTVEYHLGNIYAKLGIATRRALRVRLAERPSVDVTPTALGDDSIGS
ncbi:helix-turn-helix transcriptional regulator [Actinophytocola glycyrrhizae]|uniref:AAA family ATPase n=1 Tax=Actinophytocola glycyrrhizae TaxID=2044873 RepID=A0ABV9SAB2_9PSEU